MQQRERVLAGCLVGVIAIAGGYALVKSAVYEPRKRLDAQIQKESERRRQLQVRLNGVEKTVGTWQSCTARTLGIDWFAAHQAFREDVALLLKRNNLVGDDLVINQYKERLEKKGPRKDFVELPLSVRAKGTLGDVVNFLKDLYQQPYWVRVDKLSLSAELGRKSARGKGKSSTEPTLTVTMTLSTLVLPTVKDIDHPTIDVEALRDPESEPVLVSASRLRQEDLYEYDKITKRNFFKLYEPPRPPPLPDDTKVAVKPTKPTPPVKVDKRRDAHKYVLSGVGQLSDGPVAYVINIDDSMEPPSEYRLNDEVDDGKVVLVVPEGMVVRVAPEKERPRSPKNYFYELGTSFDQRQEVNPSDHPGIARLLRLVLQQPPTR